MGGIANPYEFGGGIVPEEYKNTQVAHDLPELKAPMNEVPAAMQSLEQENERLACAIKILFERTAPVRHQSDKEGAEDRAVRDYGSDLARGISDQAFRVSLARQTVEKILTELEI